VSCEVLIRAFVSESLPLALESLRAASQDRAEVPREQAGGDCLHHLAPRASRMGVRIHPADVRTVARRGERQCPALVVVL
jgi:hypothetical protein